MCQVNQLTSTASYVIIVAITANEKSNVLLRLMDVSSWYLKAVGETVHKELQYPDLMLSDTI